VTTITSPFTQGSPPHPDYIASGNVVSSSAIGAGNVAQSSTELSNLTLVSGGFTLFSAADITASSQATATSTTGNSVITDGVGGHTFVFDEQSITSTGAVNQVVNLTSFPGLSGASLVLNEH
jgi:hypothetical protein